MIMIQQQNIYILQVSLAHHEGLFLDILVELGLSCSCASNQVRLSGYTVLEPDKTS